MNIWADLKERVLDLYTAAEESGIASVEELGGIKMEIDLAEYNSSGYYELRGLEVKLLALISPVKLTKNLPWGSSMTPYVVGGNI